MWPSQSWQPQPPSYGIDSIPEPDEPSGFNPQLGGGIPNRYNGRPTLPESSYPAPSRVPESLTSRGWPTEDAHRPAITPGPSYPAGHGHAPLPLVPIDGACSVLVDLISHLLFPDTYYCFSCACVPWSFPGWTTRTTSAASL